jgi:hypothetical protein
MVISWVFQEIMTKWSYHMTHMLGHHCMTVCHYLQYVIAIANVK